jgi:hypothetical protein
MSPVSKRQQTMAKRNREQAVEEKRTLKRLRKQAARAAKAAGETPDTSESTTPDAEQHP